MSMMLFLGASIGVFFLLAVRKDIILFIKENWNIGSGSFIGANSVILAGTQLKENSIVGAVEKYCLK